MLSEYEVTREELERDALRLAGELAAQGLIRVESSRVESSRVESGRVGSGPQVESACRSGCSKDAQLGGFLSAVGVA